MKKTWEVSEEEFRTKLLGYTADDYLKGTAIHYHANLLQCDYEKYSPFSKILIIDAVSKGIKIAPYTQMRASITRRITRARAILNTINRTLEERIPEQKVGVLPIMCGNGKSSAISQKILDVIRANDGHGLIVVTDSVDRLNEYIRPSHNEILCDYFTEHENRYTLMTADTLLEAVQKQHSTPVLLMTMQRYFSLSPDEIKQYTRWDGGVRDTILIDEHPPLRQIVHVSCGDIHTVAGALVDGIGNEDDQEEKRWCIQEWNKVQERFYRVTSKMENCYPEKRKSYFFYTNSEKCVTSDDERFLRYIAKNGSTFKRYKDGEALRILKAVFKIERDGAIFQSQKGLYYGNTFSALIDNREMVTDIGAKVLILDGTADLHPDYNQDYIHFPRLEPYENIYIRRHLGALKISFIDFPTSKSRLVREDRNNEWKRGIMEYIAGGDQENKGLAKAEEPPSEAGNVSRPNPKIWPIFTYKEIEGFFRRNGYENVEHFGNLKGRNNYRNNDMLIQIGLHRFDPLYYLTYALYTSEGMIESFRNMSLEQSNERIQEIVDDPHSCEDIMYPMILEDIEQNFFRGTIRNDDETNRRNGIWSTYWIFCDTKENRTLINLAAKRYGDLAAQVQVIDNPVQKMHAKSMARKSKKPTAYQAVCRWLERIDTGRVFKRADILVETGISIKAYEEMIRKHPEIKARFEGMAIEGKKHVYKKNG